MSKKWEQIGGDVDPKDHGAVLARKVDDYIEVVDIEPDPAGGYYVMSGDFHISDLSWARNRGAARANGHDTREEWEDATLEHRAMDRLRYGPSGGVRQVTKWSDALPARSNQIAWWR